MGSVRRMLPLILSFLLITVALVSYVLGLGDVIEQFDMKIMEQSLIELNWKQSD
jgi:hypothetical protein